MRHRVYLLFMFGSLFMVSAISYYSYFNLISPLKDSIIEVQNNWNEIAANEKLMSIGQEKMGEVANANLKLVLALRLEIEALRKENKKLNKSLAKAVEALSQKESSISLITVLGLLIAFIAMMPSWIDLILRLKKKEP